MYFFDGIGGAVLVDDFRVGIELVGSGIIAVERRQIPVVVDEPQAIFAVENHFFEHGQTFVEKTRIVELGQPGSGSTSFPVGRA